MPTPAYVRARAALPAALATTPEAYGSRLAALIRPTRGPVVWLDSATLGGPHGARFSALALPGPLSRTLHHRADPTTGTPPFHSLLADASSAFTTALRAQLPLPEVPDCILGPGWFGVWGYGLRAETEPSLPFPAHNAGGGAAGADDSATGASAASDDPAGADGLALFADRVLVLDHDTATCHALALTDGTEAITSAQEQWAAEILAALTADSPTDRADHTPTSTTAPTYIPDLDRAAYLQRIARAQEFIAAGDSYEICLTTTARGPAIPDPLSTYLTLRRRSPAPYACYAHFPGSATLPASARANDQGVTVLSASLERFLRVDHRGRISAKPIKGTRPRGSTPEADAALARDLARSVKDRAENLMIVDLLRNDLSRVCRTGSVQVSELFAVETYSHVHQLVSTIIGDLADAAPASTPPLPLERTLSAITAAFPPGSMTGAPKPRTMELIDLLEPAPRGLYSGAAGFLGLGGAADLNVLIRSVRADAEGSSFGIGGAIVTDSDPAAEWEEILVKARGVLAGLGAQLASPRVPHAADPRT